MMGLKVKLRLLQSLMVQSLKSFLIPKNSARPTLILSFAQFVGRMVLTWRQSF